MQKFSAVFSSIITVMLAIWGISVYTNSRGGYMTFFGTKMSPVGFAVLILVLAAIDIFYLKRAFGAEKIVAKTQTSSKERVMARNANLGTLEVPCAVNLTRLSSMVGAAVGVEVYLNGDLMGVVKSGGTVNMMTGLRFNEVSVFYKADNTQRTIEFEAVPGGNIQINLKYTGAVLTIVGQA